MILLELKQYIAENGQVSLLQLMRHFQRDAVLLRNMLQHFIVKNEIERVIPEGCGSKCTQCDPSIAEEYRLKNSDI